MQHEVHVCANGLTVLAAPRRAFPLVSVQVWVGTGSMLEGAHLGSGISHLLEHQVFKGSAEYSGGELNRRVPELGGSWNAYTTTDRTVYLPVLEGAYRPCSWPWPPASPARPRRPFIADALDKSAETILKARLGVFLGEE